MAGYWASSFLSVVRDKVEFQNMQRTEAGECQ